LRRGYESQEQAVRAAVLGQFPRIELGFTHTRDSGGFYTVGFGVNFDIPLFDRNQGRIAVERATRRQLFDEYVQRLYEARSDVVSAATALRSIEARLAAVEAAIPTLEGLVAIYRKASADGSADILSFRHAQDDLAHKRVELIQLRRQRVDHAVALELASGSYASASSKPECPK
jgi:outer membrane protein TolC